MQIDDNAYHFYFLNEESIILLIIIIFIFSIIFIKLKKNENLDGDEDEDDDEDQDMRTFIYYVGENMRIWNISFLSHMT